MKTLSITIILAFFAITNSFAQDLIYNVNGNIKQVKILEVTKEKVRFKNFNAPEGDEFSASRSVIEKIVYEDGTTLEINKSAEALIKTETKIVTTDPALKKTVSGVPQNAIYGAILGAGGLISANYERSLGHKHPWVHPYAKIGMGFSNKAFHIPASLTLGIGNARHQVEFGVGLTTVLKFSADDMFKTIFGETTKALVHPVLGYRYASPKGFLFNFTMTPIIAKDRFNLENSWNNPNKEEWGITPWVGIGLGYMF